MAEESYKISDLEDALQKAGIEYEKKLGLVNTSVRPYEFPPIMLQGDITIKLQGEGDNYSHGTIETPKSHQIGFLDAIAERIAIEKGVNFQRDAEILPLGYLGSRSSLSKMPIHYFFLPVKEPEQVVQAVHAVVSANNLYLQKRAEHNHFIANFVREP